MYKNKLLITLAISLFLFSTANLGNAADTPAVDTSAGEALYTAKGCTACHGAEGKKPIVPTYPKINGQSKDYLFQQLKDFKSGSRSNSQAVLMKAIVQAIDDSDLESISLYLSEIK